VFQEYSQAVTGFVCGAKVGAAKAKSQKNAIFLKNGEVWKSFAGVR
jgi:hypothetical protein